VVVCGGGLAGVAAACEAAGLGARVTLVERRPFLGGRAFSFTDAASDREIDNGQHVFLGCCTAYIGLLRLLGTLDATTLQPRLDVPVRDRAGSVGRLRAAPVPAPFHLTASFAAYPHLTLAERAAAVRALLALVALRPGARDQLDDRTFADWLHHHGQTDRAIARFWDLIVLPTCNDRSDRVSAALAAFVFQEGFLRTSTGSAIGWPRVGLTRVVDPAARTFLEARGGTVLSSRGVAAVGERHVELRGGERLEADGIVLAVPPRMAHEVAPDALPREPGLNASPIVNVHLWYDRAVMDAPFEAVIDSPAQWIFNRSAMDHDGAGRDGEHHLAVSISGARGEVEVERNALAAAIREEVETIHTRARHAELVATTVVKEPRATFAAAPGQASRRPGTATPVPTIALAGAWTDTGWPATMEGAVRSGIRAARHLLVGR
jgi:squalene-associated FAD-dependent desaturase